ncbi:endosome/lysosome-associated apoptosis and autophagy regulator family member 2-like isoform X2 [Physella acuta]|uniref:endosome/lysosome-associated apoptosis and autophagy regulator family member 2-like isoform X2 n=1 Tax=Physella acuta TaxID=109671 RepID=UPI0027DC92BF|nr:endosome/lysosome-associated apoptosis and autophagy regulator family member 2-like isoform X2 [Physella acuta]
MGYSLIKHSFDLLFVFAFLDFMFVGAQEKPPCHLDDYHYEYTECDSEGGRWRVSVPKNPDNCVPGQSPGVAARGKECNFACSAGQYLDIQGKQDCLPCPAGTYSLGGGIRFDEWEKLPTGFAVKVERVGPSSGFDPWRKKVHEKEKNCSRSEWTTRGNYIMSVPGQCPSNLLFSAKLVRPGKVSFEYQYTDVESIFHFTVQNDQCQALDSEDNDRWPEITTEGKWATIVINLKSGMNVLQWRTIGALSDMMHTSVSPVLIRKIEITGVAYTYECTKCANGTYSSGGSSFCQFCGVDTYSGHGAAQCTPCQATEYAEPGSASCTMRPACTLYDYYKYQKPCNADGKTQVSYKWIEPKICNDKDPLSVPLPNDGEPVDCPPCNAGMYQVNNSNCEFCPPNHYVDEHNMCMECKTSTSPKYQIDYKYWTEMPPNVSTHCVSVGMSDCTSTAGWIPSGDHIRTSFGVSDTNIFIVLILKLAGFKGEPGTVDGKPIPLSTVTFDLEMECATACQLLLLTDATGKNAVLQTWESSTPRKTFSHDIYTNESLTLTWAFQPDDFGLSMTEAQDETIKMKNVAKIYNILVTNTLEGGATMCESCPQGKSNSGCKPCPDGQYIDSHTQRCEPCPEGTVLPSSNSWGKSSCKPCGLGLHPVNGRSCKSDCRYTDDLGRQYDFTALDGVHFIAGVRLFTVSGTQYYHGFNISLCSYGNKPLPTCVNNVTTDALLLNQPGALTSMVCRSTLIPSGDQDKPVSTQPVSLGTHLTKILTNISLQGLYTEDGFPAQETERDIHFYYESGGSTSACPNGRTTIISLRCDPDKTGQGEILLPPKCSDGTCDGCLFHFLWLTNHACPRCRREDYSVLKGECIKGEQRIHYFPPAHCTHLPEDALTPVSQKCQVLPFAVMVAIPVSLGLGLIMMLLLIYCWSRNKKLEYKYMKLVETAGGHDGELPAAETCGMEDDEEDVHFVDHKSISFLGKIKEKFSKNPMKEDDNPFVAVKMSEKMSLT